MTSTALLWDCHAHLLASELSSLGTASPTDADLTTPPHSAPPFPIHVHSLLAQAWSHGVGAIVCVAEDLAESELLLRHSVSERETPTAAAAASRRLARLLKCVGVHPVKAASVDADGLRSLETLVDNAMTNHRRTGVAAEGMGEPGKELEEEKEKEEKKREEGDSAKDSSPALHGIGECGLDFSPHVVGSDEAAREHQRTVFAAQIALASKYGLPLNVHSRSAGHHAIDMLRRAAAPRALLHAFDGRPHYAEAAEREGYFFSVPPSIVRSPAFQTLARRLPLHCLVLESDAPALGPVKGETNVPWNVVVSLQELARIKGVSEEEVRLQTTANARRLFGLTE